MQAHLLQALGARVDGQLPSGTRPAILFANFLEREVLFPYAVTREDLGLPGGSLQVRLVQPSGATEVGALADALERTERLPPLGFAMVEIKAPDGR